MKMYVCTDLHGHYEIFSHMKNYMDAQEDREWRCIFLGDACDRGPNGYVIMQELLADNRFIYLKGNHEDLFVKSAKRTYAIMGEEYDLAQVPIPRTFSEATDWIYDHAGDPDIRLYINNGGAPTLRDWILDKMPMSFVRKIDDLNVSCSYENFDFCHAGCRLSTWTKDEYDDNDLEEMIWSRSHFTETWAPGRFLIHGHTPSPSFVEDMSFWGLEITPVFEDERREAVPYVYQNDSKINLDTGLFRTGAAYLLLIPEEENDGEFNFEAIQFVEQ